MSYLRDERILCGHPQNVDEWGEVIYDVNNPNLYDERLKVIQSKTYDYWHTEFNIMMNERGLPVTKHPECATSSMEDVWCEIIQTMSRLKRFEGHQPLNGYKCWIVENLSEVDVSRPLSFAGMYQPTNSHNYWTQYCEINGTYANGIEKRITRICRHDAFYQVGEFDGR